jgi:hypothetical protein
MHSHLGSCTFLILEFVNQTGLVEHLLPLFRLKSRGRIFKLGTYLISPRGGPKSGTKCTTPVGTFQPLAF